MELKKMSLQQLKHGIIRCEARLSGILPIGLMRTEHRVREAMREYQTELDNRKQKELDFK
ncbi:hypothetical protein HMPREF9455_01849 [Dysgonomonas gadei ATCC BAA-286]|uniref:Uncharacterized protein n=1 Tax=Dysgonomonas gadei ATCC BAA-286 TaxID=742766 RepID=F5IXN2_9BACT|nr:hypothetical protein [Dysgonomonas sp. GY75]EGK01701.1 hypothetical protein HMPREF9455_01849 [Dysgonomonas gadei ATCC BAA-286]MBF0648056.1 hypothetical protein [Dysgonomonas sp. GY75]